MRNDWFISWLHLSKRRSRKLEHRYSVTSSSRQSGSIGLHSNKNILYPYKTIRHFLTSTSVTSECLEILSPSFSLTIVGLFSGGMLDLVGPHTQNCLC